MMTSSNRNIFRITGHLCREFPVTGEFPAQRPVMRSFDAFFDLNLNKRLSKQSWGWRFEMPSRPLWSHCNVHNLGPWLNLDRGPWLIAVVFLINQDHPSFCVTESNKVEWIHWVINATSSTIVSVMGDSYDSLFSLLNNIIHSLQRHIQGNKPKAYQKGHTTGWKQYHQMETFFALLVE